jgi:DNA-binding IclR family transcriptional regulator
MTIEKTNRSKYHVTNLERALKVFELLAEYPKGLTSSDISKFLNVSRNSIFRIVSTLVDYDYLIRSEETRTYRLSIKLVSVGIKSHTSSSLVEHGLPVMHQLQAKYKETVPLGVISGVKGIVLEKVEGSHSFRYVLDVGKLWNLHTSAPGKAMMAYLPMQERRKLVQRLDYSVFNERTISSPEKMMEALEDVRKKGYAWDMAEETEGMHCVGAPIFDHRHRPIAAIWITGPSSRIRSENMDEIGADIRQHADVISDNLKNEPHLNGYSSVGDKITNYN